MKKLMEEATKAYNEGKPFLSDEEYDALEKLYGMKLYPDGGDVPHLKRMYSLKKHYDRDGELPLQEYETVTTPKWDGAAVALYYLRGKLEMALTRGDGIKGRDITEKMRILLGDSVGANFTGQITGEVLASLEISNPRNFVAGALNLKSLDTFRERLLQGSMCFMAYDIDIEVKTYREKLHTLEDMGLLHENMESVAKLYPTDGLVIRVNDEKTFKELGYTDKFPRGAIAWKEEKEAVETTILDVVWQTGKSGKVTPVAILEEVYIDEAKVSRATLNNIAYIEALGLYIGARVKVIRSGEIIPKIIGLASNPE